MTDARDENGELLPDDVRLTKFGRLLRSTSLDELPEVFNILRGVRGIIGTTKKNLDFSRVVTA
jgi:lipopolysaccharide/colanic/teichoic acid biosynthesis glycosyltransferase